MIAAFILAALLQQPSEPVVVPAGTVVVPAGTVIPISLTSRVTTKHAKDGDGVYGKTVFPITVNNKIVIPEGSNVRGKITQIQKPGRVKGEAALTLTFQTLVLPNGP